MDEVSIGSGFIQGIIIKIIKKVIKQKIGCEPNLKFNDPIQIRFDGGQAKLHINLDAEISKDDLQKLIKDLI